MDLVTCHSLNFLDHNEAAQVISCYNKQLAKAVPGTTSFPLSSDIFGALFHFLSPNKYNKLQNDEKKLIMSATKSFEPPHHQAGGLGPKPNNCGAKSNTHNVAGNENMSTLRNCSSDLRSAAPRQ